MKYNPDTHQRRSIRLKGYDYSNSGAYYITICINDREILLNENNIKEMIYSFWYKLPEKFNNVSINEFVVMPNHIHGIIFLNDPNKNMSVGADPCVCQQKEKLGERVGSPLPTIGRVIQWFKTMTTNEYIKGIKNKGWKPFIKRFWQRNYYEHIIRNEEELNQIREYIINNPLKWDLDKENPQNLRANI
jgi:REP element-mobilizing transposase RayT